MRSRLASGLALASLLGSLLAPLGSIGVRAEDAAPAPAPAEDEAPGKVIVPPAYRGPATPLDSDDTIAALRRAAEHFAAREWARGLAVADAVLERVTAGAPPPRSRRPPRAALPDGGKAMARDAVLGAGDADESEGAEDEEPDVVAAEETATIDGILYQPVPAMLRRWLSGLPAEAREVARRTYESAAAEALSRARALGRADVSTERVLAALRKVADRYALTPSAGEALAELADRLAEAGRYAEAARVHRARLDLVPPAQRATVLAQLAAAELRGGFPRSGKDTLSEVARSHGASTVRVRGEPVAGDGLEAHPLFRGLIERAEESAPLRGGDPSEESFAWIAEGATFDGTVLPFAAESLPETGSQVRWVFSLVDGADADSVPGPSSPQRSAPHVRPVCLGERVYLRKDSELVALSARTGKILWRADPAEGASPSLSGMRPGMVVGLRTFPASRGEGGATACLALHVPKPPERALVIAVDSAWSAAASDSGRVRYAPNRLVAYDALTGKLRWRASAFSTEARRSRELAITAAPVIAAGRVLVPALQGESVYVAAFSTAGRVDWTRRLYTWSLDPRGGRGGSPGSGVPLAAREDVVVAAPGHGMVFALSAADGCVLWGSRYRAELRRGYAVSRGDAPPPLLLGGVAVVAPADSDTLTAFDLRTGAILWERASSENDDRTILGGDERRLLVAGSKVRALDPRTGKPLWETSEDRLYPGDGILLERRLLLPGSDGSLLSIDADSGKLVSRLRILDRRLQRTEPIKLSLARGEILASTPTRVFALEPQSASWAGLPAEESRDPFQRVRLLRSEGRYDEALDRLEALHGTFRSQEAVGKVRAMIVETAREAAARTGEARYLARIFQLDARLIEDRAEALSLKLLEAKHLEDEAEKGDAGSLDALVKLYLELRGSPGERSRAHDGVEVDPALRAGDGLAAIRARGHDLRDPAGEKAVPAAIEKALRSVPEAGPGLSSVPHQVLADIILRYPHLPAAGEAVRELAGRAETVGDDRAAAELRAMDRLDVPGGEAPQASLEDVTGIEPTPPSKGLLPFLERAGAGALARRFWEAAGEDEFLVESAPRSDPLPGVPSIAGTRFRLRNRKGEVVVDRELPYYPDVSDKKATLQSHIEEPALALLEGDFLLLFTPAGIYGFDVQGRSADRPLGTFRLRWLSPIDHPLLGSGLPEGGRRIFGGTVSLPENRLFFPETIFDPEDRPIEALGDGSVFSLDLRTGKYRWRLREDGSVPTAPPVLHGPWIHFVAAGTSELRVFRNPDRPRRGGATAGFRDLPSSVRCAQENTRDARIVGGGLATVFIGGSLDVVETLTGKLLWKTTGSPASLAFTRGSELWFSEPGGRLVARSLRSGRELRRTDLPASGVVLDLLRGAGPTPGAAGPAELGTAIVGGGGNLYDPSGRRRPRGASELHAVRLGAGGDKLAECRLHAGQTVYAGGARLAGNGRWVLAFNAETEPEKWYTRLVLLEAPACAVRILASVEIKGAATGRAPRTAVLEDGIAVDSADGFGLFSAPEGESGNSPAGTGS